MSTTQAAKPGRVILVDSPEIEARGPILFRSGATVLCANGSVPKQAYGAAEGFVVSGDRARIEKLCAEWLQVGCSDLHEWEADLAGVTTRAEVESLLERTGTLKAYVPIPTMRDEDVDFAAIAYVADASISADTPRKRAGPEAAAALKLDRSGEVILDETYAFIGQFVSYPSDHARIAHTLWLAHTHSMDSWESTPRIAFLSPEPGSGKTRALEISETLVPRPVESINASPAYIFRRVSAAEGPPTILFDEIDTIFGPKAKDNEELRGIINAGHRRGAMAGRCVVKGKTIETEELPAYCAVAIAGLGALPDTILSRSVVIRMRRRAPGEVVKAYRRRLHAPEGFKIRDRLGAWAESVRSGMRQAWPAMPPGVEDRDADVWEALLAVADAAGGEWPARAREAAVALVADSKGSTPSLGVRLLSDLRNIFGGRDSLASEDILRKLAEMDEAPWADLRGKPIDSRKLAGLLRPYGVASKNVRLEQGVVKGYAREDLYDPWSRYLGPSPLERATPATGATANPPQGSGEESF